MLNKCHFRVVRQRVAENITAYHLYLGSAFIITCYTFRAVNNVIDNYKYSGYDVELALEDSPNEQS